jgi:hypothetical protein
MGVKSVQTYVNIESGLIFKTLSTQPLKMDACWGKSCKVETLELDHLLIDGKFYEIIGWYKNLAHVVELKDEEKPMGVSIADKELREQWDINHRTLWDIYWKELPASVINEMADIATAGKYGISVEELNRRVK